MWRKFGLFFTGRGLVTCMISGFLSGGGLTVALLMHMLGRVLPPLVSNPLTHAGRVLIRMLLNAKFINSDIKDNLYEPIYRQGTGIGISRGKVQ